MWLYLQCLLIHKSGSHIYTFFLPFLALSSSCLLFFFLCSYAHYLKDGIRNFAKQKMLWNSIRANLYHRLLSAVLWFLCWFYSATKAHTRLSPFHQILTKDLIHTGLNYTTKRKILLKNSLASRWKSCEFLRLYCCWFPTNARMWEGIVSKGE